MKRSSVRILSIVWLLCLALCSCGGTSAAGNGASAFAPPAAETYRIGKGDVLQIDVWKEPTLSGEMPVRGDGKISLPLVGDLTAAGLTPSTLRSELETKLKEFIANPVVTVIVRSPASNKFYVLGEVRNPGEYDLVKDLTIVQAIARAGGFGEWAAKNRIILLRYEDGVEKRIRVNFSDIVKGNNTAENFRLRANDTIIVP